MDKVYNPNQLSVVFGLTPITGFAEDTSLVVDRENPQYKFSHDIHGNVSRCRVNRDTAKITITLTQSSKSNITLNQYLELDRVSDSGVFPIMIKEPTGRTIFACEKAVILEAPKIGFGSEEKDREWVIYATNISQFVGS